MSRIKIMLLGIALMLSGICLRCIFIGYEYSFFIEMLWIILPISGLIAVFYGFFSEERQEEFIEKTYNLLLKQKEKEDENLLTCEKCGREYKNVYNSCPHCGFKK